VAVSVLVMISWPDDESCWLSMLTTRSANACPPTNDATAIANNISGISETNA
jgi:hypothetical protein